MRTKPQRWLSCLFSRSSLTLPRAERTGIFPCVSDPPRKADPAQLQWPSRAGQTGRVRVKRELSVVSAALAGI